MFRLILIFVIVLFVMWLLRPFFKTKTENKNVSKLDEILNSNKSNVRNPNTFFIIIAVIILLVSVVWLLPKFGINILSLFQKIIPMISTLRGIIPF